jgi:ubiquinone/menaquinone biosynthesis C-methylase UbiE
MNESTQQTASAVLKGLQSYWTDRSPSYSAQNVAEMNNWKRKAWTDLILQHAPARQRLRILDVGTGPGFFAMALALEGHDVTAIDVTEQMLAHAKENANAYGADVKFVLHRGEALPFADGSFDLIVSRNVTWNLEFPDEALREWKRVLSPGGRMVYFDANWYLYLFDEAMREKREAYRKEYEKRYPGQTGGGDLSAARVRDLETIAYDLPLSKKYRPAWDTETLTGLDMQILRVIDDVGPLVEDEAERARDHLTPVFMVCAEKGVV